MDRWRVRKRPRASVRARARSDVRVPVPALRSGRRVGLGRGWASGSAPTHLACAGFGLRGTRQAVCPRSSLEAESWWRAAGHKMQAPRLEITGQS